MKLKRSTIAPAALFVVTLLSGGWFLQRGIDQEQNVYLQARLLQEVVDHIAERYVDTIDRATLYDSAVEGVIRQLGDPNTSLLNVTAYENFRIQTEGDYGGVGLEIVERDGWVTVVNPLPGTPGSRAGIRAGDQIAVIDEVTTEGWDVTQVVDVLRGRPGSKAELKIRRPGVDELIPFTIERAVINIRSVPFASMVGDGVGYVPLQLFSETSSREVRAAIDSLRKEGMKGLVLDLRGNPGGLLDEGVALADLFLEPGRSVVETRGKSREQNHALKSSRQEVYPDLALVVLVDEGSASASEIVAGALQDHDRALLIGSTSYGKGSVQSLFRLSGGNVLKLTTAHWFTPSGRSIQKEREDQLSLRTQGVVTVSGQLTARPDTAGRDQYSSGRGRTLYGGGGITPDLLIMPDTLTTEEQRAVQTGVYRQAGAFNVALFSFAVRYLQQNPDLRQGFSLGRADLNDFHATLVEREIDLDRETFNAARRFIAYQLEREIVNQKWGEAQQFQHGLRHDLALQEAIRLLALTDSPDGLFRVAGSAFGNERKAMESGVEPAEVLVSGHEAASRGGGSRE